MSAVISLDRRSETAATGILVRDATDGDLPAIIDIYNAAIATRTATAQLELVTVKAGRAWLSEHSGNGYPFWVADMNERVTGWLSCKPFLPRCAYRGTVELSVYVDQNFRRHGVARKLLKQAITRAPALGITAMIGLIFAHNEPSLRLFERLGFVRWGLLPQIARVDGVKRDLVIFGRCCAERNASAESTHQRQ
jgi:L-amino acid N-acyltransferase YncA